MTVFSTNETLIAARPAPRRRFGLFALMGLATQRRQLAELSPEQLDDIGVSAEAAEQEASRPVWDVPAHWVD